MTDSPRSEFVPAAIALAIGIPLVFTFTRAMHDGEVHRKEAPLRAMIGHTTFEQLARGEKTEQHYYGSSLSAPDFDLKDRHGKSWRLSDRRGKIVVMNFWTVTCKPCIEEMPSLIRLAQRTAGRNDVELVTVTTDKTWEEVAPVIPDKAPLTVLFDPDKSVVQSKYGSKLFPETWIIDGRGVVRLRVDGPRDWAGVLAWDAISSFL